MTTGQRIRQRRLELGLTQEELAIKLGNKSRASVCTVEKDKEDLTTTRIKQYAEALETTPLYLLGLTDSPTKTAEDILRDAYVKSAEAKEFIDLFRNATPEAQSAAVLVLKSQQQKP